MSKVGSETWRLLRGRLKAPSSVSDLPMSRELRASDRVNPDASCELESAHALEIKVDQRANLELLLDDAVLVRALVEVVRDDLDDELLDEEDDEDDEDAEESLGDQVERVVRLVRLLVAPDEWEERDPVRCVREEGVSAAAPRRD